MPADFLGKYRLPVPYGQFKQRISDYAKSIGSSIQGDVAFLEQISERSGAFVPVPKRDTDRELSIWGNGSQLRAARRILSQFLSISAPNPPKKKSTNFAKIMSYSETKEAQVERVEKHGTILQQLRQKPDSSITLSETMLFLWPGDELPLEAALGSNLEDLDPLRKEFGCYIYIYDEDPNYIRIDAHEHEAVVKIVHRLRAKWAELMANRHVKVKLYLVQPPPTDLVSNEVEIFEVRPSGSRYSYATPMLCCEPISGSLQSEDRKDKDQLVRAKNEVRLREAVERSLQGLRFLRGHVRMRLNFGTFVLDDYRIPQNSRSRLEFQRGEMDLLAKCAMATDLLAPYEATAESLADAEPLYAVNFEIEGENAGLLRLEAEFAKSPASGLFEVSQKRWVNPQGKDKSGDKRPPLQIALIGFDSSDWQLEIKAQEFHEPENISQSLRTFSHSVQFLRGPTDGLRGEGKRRVTFSDGAPVSRLVEKSALRYRLKGTNYILELARYDEYQRVRDLLPGQHVGMNLDSINRVSEKPITTWGASMFDLQWDNMLGQHANFGVGHAAEWSPSLNTFFPCRDNPNSSDVRFGFSQFLELANRIAALLGPDKSSDNSKIQA
ncbi:hypothetical protein VTO42DRAFT_8108 [Malbranchea cinnamomea]